MIIHLFILSFAVQIYEFSYIHFQYSFHWPGFKQSDSVDNYSYACISFYATMQLQLIECDFENLPFLAVVRGYLARKHFLRLLHRRHKSATTIQAGKWLLKCKQNKSLSGSWSGANILLDTNLHDATFDYNTSFPGFSRCKLEGRALQFTKE